MARAEGFEPQPIEKIIICRVQQVGFEPTKNAHTFLTDYESAVNNHFTTAGLGRNLCSTIELYPHDDSAPTRTENLKIKSLCAVQLRHRVIIYPDVGASTWLLYILDQSISQSFHVLL